MEIGIIGGGSIGLLVASYLVKNNHQVTLYLRRVEQKEAINHQGISLSTYEVPIHVSVKLTNEIDNHDLLILCVKQGAVVEVLQYMKDKHLLSPILFLQNGMGHVSLFQGLHQQLFVGVVEHGALRVNDTTVIHTGVGQIRVASVSDNRHMLNELKLQMESKQFAITIENNWYAMLADKLVVNAVINPLTAIFKVKNGEIIENPHLFSIARELCYEACIVLDLPFQEKWDYVYQVALKTKENESSMYKDIQKNRKTENEAISGYIVNQAMRAVPFTSFVYQSIQAMEFKRAEGESK